MKKNYAVFLIILFFAFSNFSQIKKEESKNALENATIKINFLDLPGVNLEKSKWEVAYELRIITEKELFEAMTKGSLKLDADKKIGEFVAKDSFTKNTLSKKENREVILTISLDKETQEKLAGDLESLVKFDNAVAQNKNTSESLSERRMKMQSFLIYATILVYDAKLKKNIIVPFNWVLPYTRFSHLPGANFEMTFEIKENGDYARSMVLPEKAKTSMTITTKQ
ncbi:hypothetical protein BH24ACI2_BH24ACI2_02310 [soil metagenome]